MKGSFVATRQAEIPAHIGGADGLALQGALGRDEDAALKEFEDVSKMFSPYTCPDDALDALGRRFALPRFPSEINGAAPGGGVAGSGYRGRLCNVFATYKIGGSPEAVVLSLQGYGVPDVAVIREENGSWPHVWYSRFTVKLGPRLGVLTVSSFIIGHGIIGQTRIGVAFTDTNQRVGVKEQILRWKATHGYAADILIDDSVPGGVLGRTFIGRLIGLNFIIGQTPIGGYDRS